MRPHHRQVPSWEITTTATTTTTDEGDSRNFGVQLPIDSNLVPDPQRSTCWNNISTSGATAGGDNDRTFLDIFEGLSSFQFEPTLQMQMATPNSTFSSHQLRELPSSADLEEWGSTGRKATSRSKETESVSREFRQSQDERPKRTRAAELHNMSERKRRNRITEKLKQLQELIPNCNKSDRASILDDAIKYMKFLQLQIQMMSMWGGAVYHPSMSLAGMTSTQIPHYISYLPMAPGMGTSRVYGMGMGRVNMYYSTTPGFPMMPVSSTGLQQLHSATAGLPLVSAPGVLPANPQLQMPMPFLASQVMTTATTATPQIAKDFCPKLKYACQGESSSQHNATNATNDNQQVPNITISQKYNVPASHMVTPSPPISDSKVAETPYYDS